MRRVSFVLVAGVLWGSVVPVVPVGAAEPAPWRQVMSTNLRGNDRFEALAVASRRSAWVFGTRVRLVDGGQREIPELIAYHWNGKRWTRSRLPSGVPADLPDIYNSNHYSPSGLSASSERNAWAVTLDDAGPPRVLRWNGSAWRLSKVARKGGPVVAVAAYGRDKALAFGRGGRTWVFEKGRWRAGKRLPFPVWQTSSDGKRVWVQAVVKKKLTVARWDGKSWRTLPATGVAISSPDAIGAFKAWPGGRVTVTANGGTRGVFLTWTGGAWSRDRSEVVADKVMRCLAADGRGGLWAMPDGLEAMDDSPRTLWHRDSRGRWTLSWKAAASGTDSAQRPEDCAAVPGTKKVWSVGEDTEHDWDTDGTLRELVLA